jgi:hypothetical protein
MWHRGRVIEHFLSKAKRQLAQPDVNESPIRAKRIDRALQRAPLDIHIARRL